jgi:hypothetical protein
VEARRRGAGGARGPVAVSGAAVRVRAGDERLAGWLAVALVAIYVGVVCALAWVIGPALEARSRFRDPRLTPGVVREISVREICATKWGRDARAVTEKMKATVAARYGVRRASIVGSGRGPCCEFDHLVPRELGGADDVDNLWPEPWLDAHRKDHEENRLHRALCAGEISLAAAQAEMRAWGQ